MCRMLVMSAWADAQFQQTPLHQAAEMGHRAIVQYLITNGAKPECRDRDGALELPVGSPLCTAFPRAFTRVCFCVISATAASKISCAAAMLVNPGCGPGFGWLPWLCRCIAVSTTLYTKKLSAQLHARCPISTRGARCV